MRSRKYLVSIVAGVPSQRGIIQWKQLSGEEVLRAKEEEELWSGSDGEKCVQQAVLL
jgi:hypothetical protein